MSMNPARDPNECPFCGFAKGHPGDSEMHYCKEGVRYAFTEHCGTEEPSLHCRLPPWRISARICAACGAPLKITESGRIEFWYDPKFSNYYCSAVHAGAVT